MLNYRKNQRIRNFIFSPITILVLAILLLLLTRSVFGVYSKEKRARENLKRVEAEFADLLEREDFLEEGIQNLATPEGIEAEIRERYGVSKPGEKVVVIIEGTPDSDDALRKKTGGFWGFIKGIFGRD